MTKALPYCGAAVATILSWLCLARWLPPATFNTIYDQKLQLACFTAFLTVGSFLLAMKAFILVRLREDVYKHPLYRARYLDQNSNAYAGNYYEGLADLGRLLVISVICSFVASVAQVSLGFSGTHAIKVVAPALCVGVLVLVFFDWLAVYLNLKDWFEFIEKDAMKDLPEAKK